MFGFTSTEWMFALAIFGFFGWVIYNSQRRSARAKAYQDALAALAANPGNSQLRVAALEAGRAHMGGLRTGGAPTVYDEQAINNDIMARSK